MKERTELIKTSLLPWDNSDLVNKVRLSSLSMSYCHFQLF